MAEFGQTPARRGKVPDVRLGDLHAVGDSNHALGVASEVSGPFSQFRRLACPRSTTTPLVTATSIVEYQPVVSRICRNRPRISSSSMFRRTSTCLGAVGTSVLGFLLPGMSWANAPLQRPAQTRMSRESKGRMPANDGGRRTLHSAVTPRIHHAANAAGKRCCRCDRCFR